MAMFTNRPELFEGNSDPTGLIPIDEYYIGFVRQLGGKVIKPYYAGQNPENPDAEMPPPRHILAEMCRVAGLTGRVALRPYMHLTEAERAAGRRFPRQIAFQSSAAAASLPFETKEWGAQNFAEVARLLRPDYRLVQLGSSSDPALPVDLDLRGKTSLREAAAVLAESSTFVGLEGFLSHLARAVDCPAVVVIGGRMSPEVVGYSANRNFYTPIACAPCALRRGCPIDLACLKAIFPEAVAAAAREQAQRLDRNLPVDYAEVS